MNLVYVVVEENIRNVVEDNLKELLADNNSFFV